MSAEYRVLGGINFTTGTSSLLESRVLRFMVEQSKIKV